MKLRVFTPDGSNSTEKDFSIATFEGDKGLSVLKQVIVAYQANARQGTSSVKNNRTVHGTGKKPFRQKGTGMGRQGARNRVQHYHGAVVHGPHPRDYSQRISKRLRQIALSRALFDRASAGEIDVIERFDIAEPKTRLMVGVLGNIAADARKVLIVDQTWTESTILAARNIDRVYVAEAADVNALDLSAYDRIVVTEKGLEQIINRANGGNGK